MRNLTSIQSASQINNVNLQIDITPVDQSTTYTFSNWHIQNLSPISYEIDFLGGFGKSSNYNVTLSKGDGLSFWKDSFRKLIKAEVGLTVKVGSDQFTPHVGIVQDIKRFANDPNLIQLQIFDRFFDNVPKYPVAAIVDSYSDVHPEVSNNDWGYPAYYGEHARPFYMTPVDCDLGSLIGPINVSSENHVTSLFFNSEQNKGIEGNHTFFLKQSWDQQSNGLNISSSENAFEIANLQKVTSRLMQITGNALLSISSLSVDPEITFFQPGFSKQNLGILGSPFTKDNEINLEINKLSNLNFQGATAVYISGKNTSVSEISSQRIFLIVKSGNGSFFTPTFGPSISEDIFTGSLDVRSNNGRFVTGDGGAYFFASVNTKLANKRISYQFSCHIDARLQSNNFLNYSIYGQQVNCSDIAISKNPVHILSDIYSQSGLGFRQDQASATQLNLANSGFNFQCYFGQRKSLTNISDEFGKITGSYIFISDSGQINFRTYQESSTVTIDKIITPDDYVEGSLTIRDNPLGTTVFDTAKAKRIAIGYNFNYTTQKFENILVADENNTAACNSVAATGINNEFGAQTEYILESDTASLYLSNLIRKKTRDEQIIECELPAQFFELELADVIRLQHPMLENSESIYQITKLQPNYLRGRVRITANELINL